MARNVIFFRKYIVYHSVYVRGLLVCIQKVTPRFDINNLLWTKTTNLRRPGLLVLVWERFWPNKIFSG